ncbi:MAG: fructosamine kinase family protein [Bacteroidia bacterium]|nr:fructosamine kinase family protein [Bacteroidia bacterium]
MKHLLGHFFQDIIKTEYVGGGDINQTMKVTTADGDYFVKYQSKCKHDFFECEADGLDFLKKNSSFRIPKVIGTFYEYGEGLLVMEYILHGKRSPEYYAKLGEKLARMHLQKMEKYGYKQDNYVGSLVQQNNPSSCWAEFFVRQRLFPFKDILSLPNKGHEVDVIIEKIHQKTYHIHPSPLHGDLWSGNHMADEEGNPVLIDPAVYCGDRAIDIAMLQLFGSLHPEFYNTYFSIYPKDEHWEFRIKLCTLYPLLVHARLFGGHYIQEAKYKFNLLLKAD